MWEWRAFSTDVALLEPLGSTGFVAALAAGEVKPRDDEYVDLRLDGVGLKLRNRGEQSEQLELKIRTHAIAGVEQWSKVLVAQFPIPHDRLGQLIGMVYPELHESSTNAFDSSTFLKLCSDRMYALKRVTKRRVQQVVGRVTLELAQLEYAANTCYSILLESEDLAELLVLAVERGIYRDTGEQLSYALPTGSVMGYPAALRSLWD
jgi:hypothetical protein